MTSLYFHSSLTIKASLGCSGFLLISTLTFFSLASLFLLSLSLTLYLKASLVNDKTTSIMDIIYLLGLTSTYMLNSYMNPLLQNLFPYLFPHNYAYSSWIYVKNSSSSPMIGLMGHSLVLRRVNNDINILSQLVFVQVFLDTDCSFPPEGLCKHFPGLRAITK